MHLCFWSFCNSACCVCFSEATPSHFWKIWTTSKLLITRCVLVFFYWLGTLSMKHETVFKLCITSVSQCLWSSSIHSDCLSVINSFCTFFFSRHYHVLAQLLAWFFPCCHWTRSQTKLNTDCALPFKRFMNDQLFFLQKYPGKWVNTSYVNFVMHKYLVMFPHYIVL